MLCACIGRLGACRLRLRRRFRGEPPHRQGHRFAGGDPGPRVHCGSCGGEPGACRVDCRPRVLEHGGTLASFTRLNYATGGKGTSGISVRTSRVQFGEGQDDKKNLMESSCLLYTSDAADE